MCREVAKPPELPCVWKMAEEKRKSLERSSEVSYFQQSFSNIEHNLVSHSSFTHIMHQQQVPSPEKAKGSQWIPDLYPPKKYLLFPFTKCPQAQGNLIPFFYLPWVLVAEATDILPCTSSRRQEISTGNLRWRSTGSRGSGCRGGGGQEGEQLPREQCGASGFFFWRGRIYQQCFEESRA